MKTNTQAVLEIASQDFSIYSGTAVLTKKKNWFVTSELFLPFGRCSTLQAKWYIGRALIFFLFLLVHSKTKFSITTPVFYYFSCKISASLSLLLVFLAGVRH